MDGAAGTGVSLSSGKASSFGSTLTLSEGNRFWRIRVIPATESDSNILRIEYMLLGAWVTAAQYVIET
ncbi:unnamed protein product [Phaeothamnion confervicola]